MSDRKIMFYLYCMIITGLIFNILVVGFGFSANSSGNGDFLAALGYGLPFLLIFIYLANSARNTKPSFALFCTKHPGVMRILSVLSYFGYVGVAVGAMMYFFSDGWSIIYGLLIVAFSIILVLVIKLPIASLRRNILLIQEAQSLHTDMHEVGDILHKQKVSSFEFIGALFFLIIVFGVLLLAYNN